MVKAPGILVFLWLLEIRLACRKRSQPSAAPTPSPPVGAAEGCDLFGVSRRLMTGLLQAEFFLAFDLDHLGVVHGDFHCPKAQIAQRALDLRRDALMLLLL
jgi:hypothetical protein